MNNRTKVAAAVATCAALAAPSAFAQAQGGHDMKPMMRKIMASQKKEIAEFDRWLASKRHKGEGAGAPKQSK